MKKLLFFFALLLSHQLLRAQAIVFYEPFDEMAGYTITYWPYQFSGVVPWQCGLPYSIGGGCMLPYGGAMSVNSGSNKIAGFAECGGINPNDSNVLTYTPAINMSSVTGAWLKYDSYFEKYVNAGDTEKATVEISTDTGTTWRVLENVAANTSFLNFQTHYLDLAAYDHAADIRIGFRYNDGGGYMQGWAIDNVTVFVPARKDLALLSVTPIDTLFSYVQTNYGYTHHVKVYNAGLDTIHSFSLSYKQSSGPVVTDYITGVTLLPFSTTDIGHSIPDTISGQGTYKVTMWVTLDSDAYHYNDTAITYLRGADFIPVKILTIESGEGTYNGWSPRNMYYMRSVLPYDINATLISVHEHDPMEDTLYHDYLLYSRWNYVPYIQFDRRLNVPLDSFFDKLNVQKGAFGFANVSINGIINGNTVTVQGTVTPAINLTGDYRLALVITEDGVTGSGSDFDQVNNYAGGIRGVMDGYETKPNPVPAADMVYNYVARQIYPTPEGMAGILPGNMVSGTAYNYALTTTIDPAWLAGKLKANVLLIRNEDSSVLNSNHMPFYLSTTNIASPFMETALYPNPAIEATHLSFDLTRTEPVKITITDLSGRQLYQYPTSTFNAGRNSVNIPVGQFATGTYLVNLFTEDGNKSMKLEVIH